MNSQKTEYNPNETEKKWPASAKGSGEASRKIDYDPNSIESKWQEVWEENQTFSPDLQNAGKPFYNLMMFPYPSAEGLHVGNMYAFTGADIYGRYQRMRGNDVFEPIGLDGFGIHSENYALKVGRHPKEQAKISEKHFYEQLRATGNAYDWTRTLETYDPDYYRWTQWLFIQMFKMGLAYRKKAQVNWCPSDKTVLADEQVIDGKCERDGSVVEKKDLEQWFFKITEYADRLLDGLIQIDWPEKIKIAQRLWIGRAEDTEIDFKVKDSNLKVKVITTRADTIFGATFLVLAPEHELVEQIRDRIANRGEVDKYIKIARSKSDYERGQNKDKTGVRLENIFAINPVNNEEIPLFIADYVLGTYGTGAIMAVPAHDDRDFDFAMKFNLPIRYVIEPPKDTKILRVHVDDQDKSEIAQELRNLGTPMEYWTPTLRRYDININESETVSEILGEYNIGTEDDREKIKKGSSFALEEGKNIDFGTVYTGDGKHINSDFLNGLDKQEAIDKATKWFSEHAFGGKSVHYHLRDWLISRQRYWGPPIPMIFCESCAGLGKSWFTTDEGKQGGLKINDERLMNEENQKSSIINHKSMAGWYPVPEEDLPVLLPDVKDWRPEGEGTSPLANHPEFYETKCPACGSDATRETDVSDTFLDSAWYYLRYLSIQNHESRIMNQGNMSKDVKSDHPLEIENRELEIPYEPELVRKWCPVAIYIGGVEHSVLHLLYVRFVAMALHDLKMNHESGIMNHELSSGREKKEDLNLPFGEPFPRFFAHGLIVKDGAKMSKSKGNVVVPDKYIEKFGADTVRLYLMFLGQFSEGGDFLDSGIEGMHRFVRRVWNLFENKKIEQDSPETFRMINKTVKEVTQDIEDFSYNTAIAKLMEFYNFISEDSNSWSKETAQSYLKLFAPFAPHFTEELHNSLFMIHDSIHFEPWPVFDEKYLVQDQVVIPIQINGKRRGEISVQSEKLKVQSYVEEKAREAVRNHLEGKEVRKVIYVPGKIINFVTN